MTSYRKRQTGLALVLTMLLALGGAAVAYAVFRQQSDRPLQPLEVLVPWAAAFFITRLLALDLPQGDEVRVGLFTGLCALGVLDARSLLIAAAAGGLVEVLVRLVQDAASGALERLIEVVRSVSILALLTPWLLVLQPMVAGTPGDGLVWLTALAGLVYAVLDILTLGIQERLTGDPAVHHGVVGLLRLLVMVYLVHVAMAAVTLRLIPLTKQWAFWVALLLTLVLQNSFNLYLRVRKAYVATIRALARAAELDRPLDAGHAQRVADLSVAVGRRMGLSSHTLERIDYAALLHDIGLIGYHGDEELGHAAKGAEIVSTIPFLADVAPFIAGPEAAANPDQQTAAAIVRCCSRFDRLRIATGARSSLEQVRAEHGAAFPRIIEVLETVVREDRARAGVRQW